MTKKTVISIPLILTATILLESCTSNPFGNNEISANQHTISGLVQVEGASPENVYVWLEGFNKGSFTDQDGRFELTLEAGFNDKVDGILKLYFYIANYSLTTEEVAIRNGEFVFGQLSLNDRGELKQTKFVKKFLELGTDVVPSSVTVAPNVTVNVKVTVTLQATADTATVVFPFAVPGLLGSIFFVNRDTGELFPFKGLPAITTHVEETVGTAPISRSLTFEFISVNLPKGRYDVLPYLLIQHEEIPQELKDSIASNVEGFGPNYLKIPFKRIDGRFEVK